MLPDLITYKRRDVRFLLAVQSVNMTDVLRRQLAEKLTIGHVKDVVKLVTQKLPGIPYASLPEDRDDLPLDPNTACFELDRSSDLFNALLRLKAAAVHVGGGLPTVQIEMWLLI